jgi:hypothetical protein
MTFRFPTHPPSSLLELFQWVRDLLPQLEPKIIKNMEIGTNETAVAHGLKSVPRFVSHSTPDCLVRIRQTKPPDAKNIYFRASTLCVVDVWVIP